MIYKLQRSPVHAGPSNAARRVAKARRKVALKGLLSDLQKARICIIATEAAHAAGVSGYKEVIAWRKQEQWDRFGLRSLRDATQEQFAEIKAHFEALAGHPDRALDTALRGEAAHKRMLELLAAVGIPDPERRLGEFSFQLSGGLKQRVMSAVALAAESPSPYPSPSPRLPGY